MDERMKFFCSHYNKQTSLELCSICRRNDKCDIYASMLTEYDDIHKDDE